MKDRLIKMYKRCRMGSNELCQACRRETDVKTNALGAYLICDAAFRNNNILFVGKVARGDSIGNEIAERLEDVTEFGNESIRTRGSPFYSYTRAIIESVYGGLEEGLPRVSFTNLVKCNNETTVDSTQYATKDYCIRQNGFVWKEIELLKPRLIVYYTNSEYDDFIWQFEYSGSASFKDKEKNVRVGAKEMPYWVRKFYNTGNSSIMCSLRIGHPERKNKKDYVQIVSNWILRNHRMNA
jgi:hypothetical protein